MKTLTKIGKFIKSERTKQKLSLAELSKKSFGSEYQAKGISLIERGMKPKVEFETINKILFALGYDLKEIFN